MQNLPSKKIIVVQIVIIFILPVALLYFKIIPDSWRVILLAIGALFLYGIIRYERWTHEEMGLRDDNILRSLPYYLSFTIFGTFILFLIANKTDIYNLGTDDFFLRTFLFFIPISFFQEFAFRGFLIPRLQLLYNNKYKIIFINAILFAMIHVIYPSINIGLIMTFVSGVLFAWLYIKYPNLLLVSLTHTAFNITAVLLGFFNLS